MRADQRTVPVGSCTSRPEAEFKRHVLLDAGIETLIATDDAGGLHPEMGFAYCGAYRLLVPEDRAGEAGALLATFDVEDADGDVRVELGEATSEDRLDASSVRSGTEPRPEVVPAQPPSETSPGPGSSAGSGSSSDPSEDARLVRTRSAVFWMALLMAAVLLAAVIANTVNVFTGL